MKQKLQSKGIASKSSSQISIFLAVATDIHRGIFSKYFDREFRSLSFVNGDSTASTLHCSGSAIAEFSSSFSFVFLASTEVEKLCLPIFLLQSPVSNHL